ncbi:MAG: G8 domain-containing protein, partial [Bacteroidota bacterium]
MNRLLLSMMVLMQLMLVTNLFGGTRYTVRSGNWSNSSTWYRNRIPDNNDNAIISSGTTVSLDATASTSGSLTIEDGGTLNANYSGDLTVGSLTISNGGVLNMYRNLRVNGDTEISGSIYFGSTSSRYARTMTFNGAVTLNQGATWNETSYLATPVFYFNGSLNNNATTFNAVNGWHNFSGLSSSISGSTLTTIPNVNISDIRSNYGALNVTGTLAGDGQLINNTGATLFIEGVDQLSTLTATAPDNTVVYSGGSQVVRNTGFYNLNFSGSGTKTFPSSPAMISGNLTIEEEINLAAEASLTVNGNFLINAPAFYTNSDTLFVNGSWTSTSTFTSGAGIIVLNGTQTQNVSGSNQFGTLVFSGNAAKTLSSGTQLVSGNLIMNGIFTVTAHTQLKVSGSVILPSADDDIHYETTDTLVVSGSWQNSGRFESGSGIIAFENAAGQNMSGINYISGLLFRNSSVSLSDNAEIHLTGNGLIEAGSILEISPLASLVSEGTLTNEAGNDGLLIRSDAGSTGTLILNNSGVAGTVERYMTKGVWHNISFAVSGQSISGFVSDPANSIGWNATLKAWGMMPYDPVNDTWAAYFKTTTPGDLIAGEGYMVRRKSSGTDGTVRSGGSIQSGDLEINGLIAGKWNSIGNPYTSYLAVTSSTNTSESFIQSNSDNLDPAYQAIYVWNEQVDYSGSRNDFVIINNAGYPNNNIHYIQSGQGFLVKMSPSATSVGFSGSMQQHSINQRYLKSASTDWYGIDLIAASPAAQVSTIVAYNETMTPGMDPGFDAGYIKNSSSLSVYTHLAEEDSGVAYGIQCLPVNGPDTLCVPVGVDFVSGGSLNITAKTDQKPAGSRIILEDRETGIFIDLDTTASGYTVDLPSGTSGTGRFYLYTILAGTDQQNTDADADTAVTAAVQLPVDEKPNVYSYGNNIYVNGGLSIQAEVNLYTIDGK